MIIFYGLIVLFIFYLLAVISEEFFVPAIDKLAHRLKLSSDAAGATLLAMGSSAPEFFTALFAIFGANTADIGSGTIVGSAIFNVLVIVGVSAMFKAVTLQWKPVLRDMIFYVLTILLLLLVFADGQVTLIESLSFVGLYIGYVFAVTQWRKWFSYKDIAANIDDEAEDKNRFRNLSVRTIEFIIPNLKKRPSAYVITFIVSLLAIAGLSHLLVENVVHIAEILNVNATFLALTILAAGTSIPDLIGSIVVAKQGRGDMAVSNAVGSNIFDILFGLGFPWLLYILINGGTVAVSKDNLLASVLLLFATVISLTFLMVARNWRLGRSSGLLLVGLYVAYIIYVAQSIA